MGLFSRIKSTVEADLHELLDQKEQKNPLSMLNQHLRQCELEIEKVRKLVQRQYLLKEEFKREYTEALTLAEKRKYQAEIALKAGENDLYDFAHQEQTQYEERSQRLKESLNQCIQELDQLERKYEEMKHKLKDMNLKRMDLMGRENVTHANQRINRVIDHDHFMGKAQSTFADMESYLDRLEHQMETANHRNTIDARIRQLEKQLKNEKTDSNL